MIEKESNPMRPLAVKKLGKYVFGNISLRMYYKSKIMSSEFLGNAII